MHLLSLMAIWRINYNLNQLRWDTSVVLWEVLRVEPHMLRNEHKHLPDHGLTYTGGEDYQNINTIK